MQRTTSTIGLAVAAIGFASAANAQQTVPSTSPTSPTVPAEMPNYPGTSSRTGVPASDKFSKLDQNNDGFIDKKEAAQDEALAKQFSTLDVNKDGKLGPGEFAAFEANPSGKPNPNR